MSFNLMHGDCLEMMKLIPDGSVDMVLADPPYGTTACKWDTVIPLEAMWAELKRIIKPNGAIVMTASQPFTSALVMSNPKWFKHEWIWQKNKASGHLNAKIMPMKNHENVVIFCEKKINYFPQMSLGNKRYCSTGSSVGNKPTVYGKEDQGKIYRASNKRYPKTVLSIPYEFGRKVGKKTGRVHPTQKPVALMEYLIRTYTNEGEIVLDFTMGSGTTGVACVNTAREFIGIELDQGYFDIAKERIVAATNQDQDTLN
jgi:DNA modification methylase